jgi:hypothetical protein
MKKHGHWFSVRETQRFAPTHASAEAGWLTWSGETKPAQDTDPYELLVEFANLGDAEDRAVSEYAGRYGVLELCEHGYFDGDCPNARAAPLEGPPCIGFTSGREGRTPLAVWRYHSGQVRAILRLAANIGSPKPREEDWAAALGWPDVESYERNLEQWLAAQGVSRRTWGRPQVRRELLGSLVDGWLLRGRVDPVFFWWSSQPQLEFLPPGLSGTLALALARRFIHGPHRYEIVCYHCGNLEARTRKPRRDIARHYCRTCRGKNIPYRYLMREHRERKR